MLWGWLHNLNKFLLKSPEGLKAKARKTHQNPSGQLEVDILVNVSLLYDIHMPDVSMFLIKYICEFYFPYIHIFLGKLAAASAHVHASGYYHSVPFAERGEPFLSGHGSIAVPVRVIVGMMTIP